MHFVPILYRRCRSKTNFYVFSYDKISLKFCASLRFFLAVFMEKFPQNPLSELCEKRVGCFFWNAKLTERYFIRELNISNRELSNNN